MDKEHEKYIEEHMNECPEGCKCHDQGIENLCKAEDVGLHTFVECLEEDPYGCQFSMYLAGAHYCKCSVRVYIAKKLKK